MTRFAFFDVAGTLVAGNPWRGFMHTDLIARSRVYTTYPLTIPPWLAKKAKLIPDATFRQIWIRQMAWMLWGMHRDEVLAVFAWIAGEYVANNYHTDVVARLKQHKANGDTVILISGMFTEMTQAFADHLGADVGLGTVLGFDKAGRCTGRIVGDGCAGHLKVATLERYLADSGLSLESESHETFAYADSLSDVPLLSLADHPTATYPDSGLAALVAERGWATIDT